VTIGDSKYRLTTQRMVLVSGSAALLSADIAGREDLAHLLGVDVPGDWPPADLSQIRDIFYHQLLDNPSLEGWLVWYWLMRDGDDNGQRLVGAGGFIGCAETDGCVRLGSSILAEYSDAGLEREAYEALIRWALQDRSVSRVMVPGYVTS
jgi:hypothetical protein